VKGALQKGHRYELLEYFPHTVLSALKV
jgi:hypothetical protein